MAKYRIHLRHVTYSYVDVEAKSADEAIDTWATADPELEATFDFETDAELNNVTRED